MPILHRHFQGEAQDEDGRRRKLLPGRVLELRGPVVEVQIQLPEPLVRGLQERGDEIPDPIAGDALIDTGATTTCVDLTVAKQLHLPQTGQAVMASASHAQHEAPQYPIAIQIQGLPINFTRLDAMGADLKAHGILALLGRDALRSAVLFYNGVAGEITLSL